LRQCPHGLENAQAGAHGTLCIILMRLRIAEVDEQPIAQILRHMPAKALDHCHTGGLIGAEDLAEIFGVELSRQAGRIGQAAEQHGELAAFGSECLPLPKARPIVCFCTAVPQPCRALLRLPI
jgi:hypothetical protein